MGTFATRSKSLGTGEKGNNPGDDSLWDERESEYRLGESGGLSISNLVVGSGGTWWVSHSSDAVGESSWIQL